MSADNLKIFFPLRFPFPNSIWLVVLRVVKKIYINASIDIFNQDTKLVDVDGFKKFPKTSFQIMCADKE